jgi:hypothetical protein
VSMMLSTTSFTSSIKKETMMSHAVMPCEMGLGKPCVKPAVQLVWTGKVWAFACLAHAHFVEECVSLVPKIPPPSLSGANVPPARQKRPSYPEA